MKLKPFIGLFFLVLMSAQVLANDVWYQRSNFGGTARHRCTAFSIGNKGYLGLGHINAVSNIEYEDFWEYDPGTDSWTQMANFGGGHRYHSIGFSVGSKGYVGMGRKDGGGYENDLWEFDPLANSWTQKANSPGGDRRGAVAFVVDGIAYVGSGEVQGGAISNEFYAYDAGLDFWYQVASFPGSARTSAVAFSIGDKGYFGTGGMGVGTTDFWEYNPSLDQWTQLADVGTTIRQEACGFALNGKGYIGTGDDFSSGNNYSDFWEYTPETDTWVQIQDFPGIARRYMVAFVIGSKAFAGVGTNGTNFRDFWMFDKTLDVQNASEINPVHIFPNPVEDYFTISGIAPENGDIWFLLYNSAGQLALRQLLQQENTTISRGDLLPSNYHYLIISENAILHHGSLILN